MSLKLDKLNPSLRKRIEDQIKNEDRANRPLPNPIVERYKAPALDCPAEGKDECDNRIEVRFVGCRVRPLDPDNFAGSVKDLLDGLRHSGLIPGDEPTKIRLITDQRKVQHFHEEATYITINDPNRKE